MTTESEERDVGDVAPGFMDAAYHGVWEGIQSYLIGLVLAALLTAAAFYLVRSNLVWAPGIPVALAVLATAQIGVHLVFFLHLTTAPDNTNNALALAFGVLIVALVIGGSLWIMDRLNANMLPMAPTMQTRQPPEATVSALTAQGVVEPPETAAVRARVSGAVTSLRCDVNMQVKAGEVCAKIDPRPFETVVRQRQNALQTAEARRERISAALRSAQAALERAEASPRRRAREIARLRAFIERGKTQVSHDEATIAGLRSALDTAKSDLASTDILAPIDGTVRARNIKAGQRALATSQEPLFVISATTVRLSASISAKDAENVKAGDKATFSVEGFPGRLFAGSVTQIQAPPEGAATTNIIVTAPNPELLLKPGMPAQIKILTPAK